MERQYKMLEREESSYLIGGILATAFACIVFSLMFKTNIFISYLIGFNIPIWIYVLIKGMRK